MVLTPQMVIEYSDVTFSCVADPQALRETVFGRFGVLSAAPKLARGKGYIEMTTMDFGTSQKIEAGLKKIGMKYVEAQILVGTKKKAEDGTLFLAAAGDRELYDICQTCFDAISKGSHQFLGEAGRATKLNAVFQTFTGVSINGWLDSLALGRALKFLANLY